MSLLLKYLAIKKVDAGSGSDIAVLSNIMEGVDGAAVFGFEVEQESVQIEDMQTLDHSATGTLDVRVLYNEPTKGLLDGLIGERVEVSGLGIDGFILWDEPPIFSRVHDYNSAILNDHITTTVKSVRGYAGGSQRFYGGRNAMSLYDTSTGSADLLNGFELLPAGAVVSRTGNEQEITTEGAGEGIRSKFFFMPFVGERLHASVDVVVASAFVLTIAFYDYDKEYQSQVSTPLNTTGRKSVDGVIPAGTAYVAIHVNTSSAEEDTMTFKEPVLTTNPHTSYII